MYTRVDGQGYMTPPDGTWVRRYPGVRGIADRETLRKVDFNAPTLIDLDSEEPLRSPVCPLDGSCEACQ